MISCLADVQGSIEEPGEGFGGHRHGDMPVKAGPPRCRDVDRADVSAHADGEEPPEARIALGGA